MARLPLLLFTLVLVNIAATHRDKVKVRKGLPRYGKRFNDAESAAPSQPNTECGMLPAEGLSKRIIGGETADPHEWPSVCRLLVMTPQRPIEKWTKGVCGSTLVKNQKGVFYIITAAHCIQASNDPIDYTVRCGIHSLTKDLLSHEQDLKVKSIIVHNHYSHSPPNSNPFFSSHDIAVLELSTQPTENDFVQAACLPTKAPEVNDNAVLVGWGLSEWNANEKIIPDVLQELVKPVISANECENMMNAGGKAYVDCDEMGIICAGHTKAGKGSCKGDSGGPLYTRSEGRWTLSGIVSFGLPPCAQDNFVDAYADVFSHLDWINDKINN